MPHKFLPTYPDLHHRLLVLLCYKIDTPIAKLRAGNEGMC